MNELGERIRKLRREKKLTQDQLAELVNANRVTIANYELGKYMPSIEALEKLADALDVSPDVITGRAERPGQEDDLFELRERLRREPELRTLYDSIKKATPEHIRAATAFFKLLESQSKNE